MSKVSFYLIHLTEKIFSKNFAGKKSVNNLSMAEENEVKYLVGFKEAEEVRLKDLAWGWQS